MGGGSHAAGVVVHQRAGLRQSSACGSRNADEVLGAALPVVLSVHRRTVVEELFCHEESCAKTGCRASLTGRIGVLQWVRGLSVLAVVVAVVAACVPTGFVAVVTFGVGVDVVVVLAGVLHPWLVRGAVSGAASAGTATCVAGGRLGVGPARCTPAGARSSSIRHCTEVVEDCGSASAPYLVCQLSESDSH